MSNTTEAPASGHGSEKAKPNTEAIKTAAAKATGDAKAPEAPTAPPEPQPPYIFGEPVPEAIAKALSRDATVRVDPSFLSVARGFNVRDFKAKENVEHVQNIKGLIRSAGEVEEDLRVRIVPDNGTDGLRLQVIRGETRLRAINELRTEDGPSAWATVPVRLAPERDEVGETADFLISNTGKNLSMLEQCTVVARLKAEGLKGPEVQKKLNFTHTAMRNLEILSWAPPALRDAISEGYLSASRVIEKLRDTEGEPEKVGLVEKSLVRLAEKMKAEGLQAAQGRKADVEGEDTGDARKAGKDGIVFNREIFKGFIGWAQDCNSLTEPKDLKDLSAEDLRKVLSKIRKGARNILENCGAPMKRPIQVAGGKEAAKADEPAEAAA